MRQNLILIGFILILIALYVIWGNLSARIVAVESETGSYIYATPDPAAEPARIEPGVDVEALQAQLALMDTALSANTKAIEVILQRLSRIENQGRPVGAKPFGTIRIRETIFFGLDNSDLTANEMAKIDRLLENVSGNAIMTLRGHADTIGDNRYNHLLSLRRAAAVKRYMDAKLRAENRTNNLLITIDGVGEESTINVTDDNVEEPSNRVVEILVFE